MKRLASPNGDGIVKVARKDDGGVDVQLSRKPQYICSCRLTSNFFVHGSDRYYDYHGCDKRFLDEYQKEVDLGIVSKEELVELLEEVKAQSRERSSGFSRLLDVFHVIDRTYNPLHPELRIFSEDFLEPSFLATVRRCIDLGSGPFASEILQQAGFDVVKPRSELTSGVVTLKKVFTDHFCSLLTQELINFAESGIEYTRPNSMNRNGGALLAELGFHHFLDRFVFEYMNPIVKAAMPEDLKGGDLDAHKVFTVAYQSEDYSTRDPETGKRRTTLREGVNDKWLSVHTDNSEATLNLHLAGDWTGGDLNVFGKGTSGNYEQDRNEVLLPGRKMVFQRDSATSRGLALFHAGSEFHEARAVDSGWRLNLIMWLRSSKVRNKQCPLCLQTPELVEIDGFAGEGFTSPPCVVSPNIAISKGTA